MIYTTKHLKSFRAKLPKKMQMPCWAHISTLRKAMFMVTATGTAVKIAPKSPEQPQSSRYDIYQKLYNLTLFKESGVITKELYDAERINLILLHKNE